MKLQKISGGGSVLCTKIEYFRIILVILKNGLNRERKRKESGLISFPYFFKGESQLVIEIGRDRH